MYNPRISYSVMWISMSPQTKNFETWGRSCRVGRMLQVTREDTRGKRHGEKPGWVAVLTDKPHRQLSFVSHVLVE
jgi:hypothetical protein